MLRRGPYSEISSQTSSRVYRRYFLGRLAPSKTWHLQRNFLRWRMQGLLLLKLRVLSLLFQRLLHRRLGPRRGRRLHLRTGDEGVADRLDGVDLALADLELGRITPVVSQLRIAA